MAQRQIAAVLICIGLLAGAGISLNFDVSVTPTIEGQFIAFDHDNSSTPLHRFTVSAANTGSVTCDFRMKADLERPNQTITRYSGEQVIHPGEEQELELEYLPYNYTGDVRGSVWVQYCDREESIGNTSFTVEERVWTNTSLRSRTVRAGNDSATVELDVERGIMVPEQAPGYWRPATARIMNGTAVVRYDPPLFDPRESLEYTVYDPTSRDAVGTVTVGLRAEPTILERVRRNGLAIGLALSGLLNILLGALLYRRRDRGTGTDVGSGDPT